MAGFFDTVKGAIWEDDKSKKSPSLPPQAVPTTSKDSTGFPNAPSATPTYLHQSPSAYKAPSDPALEKRLLTQVSANGPALQKLIASLSELEDVIPDEATRYRAAIKLTKKGGVALDQILEDFEKCKAGLDFENKTFSADCDKQVAAKVEVHNTTAASIQKAIADAQEQIRAAQAHLVEMGEELQTERTAAAAEETKINSAREKFQASLGNVRSLLDEQKAKVAKHGMGM